MQEAESAAHQSQSEAEESRKSALAMARQLKRCVSDLEDAQKQLASQERVCVRSNFYDPPSLGWLSSCHSMLDRHANPLAWHSLSH